MAKLENGIALGKIFTLRMVGMSINLGETINYAMDNLLVLLSFPSHDNDNKIIKCEDIRPFFAYHWVLYNRNILCIISL